MPTNNVDFTLTVDVSTIRSVTDTGCLVVLSVKDWKPTATDKAKTKEVTEAAGAAADAGSFKKDRMSGCQELKEVNKLAHGIRTWNAGLTRYYADGGLRYLPQMVYAQWRAELDTLEAEYLHAAGKFAIAFIHDPQYLQAVRAALGNLFNESEYPTTVDAVKAKFGVTATVIPMKDVQNDWHKDATEQLKTDMADAFQRSAKACIGGIARQAWEQLYKIMQTMVTNLTAPTEANASGVVRERKNITESTFITHPEEFLNTLHAWNITNDPFLDSAAAELKALLHGLSLDSLKASPHARDALKAGVTDIMDKFSF
jgi:hypothetical protein